MKVVATKWGNSASVPIPAAVMAAVRRWARRHEALLNRFKSGSPDFKRRLLTIQK